ncbi:MAG: hypothetical protein LBM26_00900 [Methanobrevibacter sp.]|jgi:predicted CopG family antitoxin|nr:hypothetical protein [Methanobrevibacter sp.]
MATVSIKDDIYKTITKLAKKENTTETKVLEDIIEKGLRNTESKIPDYLIGNKDTYDPNPERRLSFAGFIKGVKPFNAVELVREMRRGE